MNDVNEYATNYIPLNFAWWIFIIGEVIILIAIYNFFVRNKTINTIQ